MAEAKSGYTSDTPTGVGLFGVLFKAYNTTTGAGTKIGISRGGLRFNPSHDIRNLPYDGKMANIRGLDRIAFRNPAISGTILQVTNENLMMFEPGGATPASLQPTGDFLASGDYYSNVAVAFERPDASVFGYNFANALVTQYEIAGQGADGEVEVAVTIEARLAHGATPDESTAPFEFFEIAAA